MTSTVPQLGTIAPVIKHKGAPLAGDVMANLVSLVFEDNRNLPDTFTIRLSDAAGVFLDPQNFKIGDEIGIIISDEALLEKGEITALEADLEEGQAKISVIRGFDKSHRLHHGRKTKAWVQEKVSGIVSSIASANGLGGGTITATTEVFPHLTQANQTDWEFVQWLADRVGHEASVVKGKLEFKKPTEASAAAGGGSTTTPTQLEFGSTLLSLRASVTAAEQVPEVNVRSFDPKKKEAVKGKAEAKTLTSSNEQTPAKVAKAVGASNYLLAEVPHFTQSDAEAHAKSLAFRIASSYTELEGTAQGSPLLKAGTPVELKRVGASLDGKYTLTSTRHVYSLATGYRTDFTVSGRQERSLLSLTSGNSGGSSWPKASPSVPGVVLGVVTDNKDGFKLHRVKVKFPWLDDSYVSTWAPLVQLGAGGQRGLQVVPEVDDLVLVAFEHGDFNRPYVLGGVFNDKDKPPDGTDKVVGSDGKVNQRDWVSRKGHRFTMIDEDGKESVTLKSSDSKYSLVLDQAKTKISLKSDGTVEIEGKNDIKITSGTGKISIIGKSGIVIESTQDVSIKGLNVKLDATTNLDAKGGVGATLKAVKVSVDGSATAELMGGALASVKAAIVKIN